MKLTIINFIGTDSLNNPTSYINLIYHVFKRRFDTNHFDYKKIEENKIFKSVEQSKLLVIVYDEYNSIISPLLAQFLENIQNQPINKKIKICFLVLSTSRSDSYLKSVNKYISQIFSSLNFTVEHTLYILSSHLIGAFFNRIQLNTKLNAFSKTITYGIKSVDLKFTPLISEKYYVKKTNNLLSKIKNK